MNARNKRLKRALKYMAIFTIAPHFILLAVNVAINVFYGIPVTEDIFSLYTPRRVIFFCIVSCIVFLEYYFLKSGGRVENEIEQKEVEEGAEDLADN